MQANFKPLRSGILPPDEDIITSSDVEKDILKVFGDWHILYDSPKAEHIATAKSGGLGNDLAKLFVGIQYAHKRGLDNLQEASNYFKSIDQRSYLAKSAWYYSGIIEMLLDSTSNGKHSGVILLSKAARLGHQKAALFLSLFYLFGDIKPDSSFTIVKWRYDMRTQALQNAVEWVEFTIKQAVKTDEFHEALFNLAFFNWGGYGLKQNVKKAVDLWRRAGNRGHKKSKYNLAFALEHGVGVEANPHAASVLYAEAVCPELPEACNALGSMLQEGQFIKQDHERAFMLYETPNDIGNGDALMDACYNRALCFAQGLGVKQDYAAAQSELQELANFGHTAARKTLNDPIFLQVLP